jgi:hypothetical protein
MVKGVMICEGEFEDVIEFDTPELLAAYSSGFSEGADKYGAGGAGVYTRDDLKDLDAEDEDDAALIAIIEEHLPE